MAGVTSDGFTRKRLPEIIEEIQDDLESQIGPLNFAPESVITQIVAGAAQPIADAWEQLENVYHSAYPDSAEGVQLDNIVSLVGLTRNAATHTSVKLLCWATVGTTIPIGFRAKIPSSGERFQAIEAITIADTALHAAEITVLGVDVAETYEIVINGTTFDYTQAGADNAKDIAYGLAVDINSGAEPVTADETLAQSTGVVYVYATDRETAFALELGTPPPALADFAITSRAANVTMQALNTGPIVCPVDSLTEIVTAVSGLSSVENKLAGTAGTDRESDSDLRTRRTRSLALPGSSTLEGLRAKLLEDVDSVTDVAIYENATDGTVSGRPPHSFECLVLGGDQDEIAQAIWDNKPAGIATHGSVTRTVTDGQGDSHSVKFSRPTEVRVYVDIVMTYNTEETFPADGLTAAKQAAYEYGQTLDVGDDVLLHKISAAVAGIAGIATISVTLTDSTPPGGTPYTAANISIDADEIATIALSDISASIS